VASPDEKANYFSMRMRSWIGETAGYPCRLPASVSIKNSKLHVCYPTSRIPACMHSRRRRRWSYRKSHVQRETAT